MDGQQRRGTYAKVKATLLYYIVCAMIKGKDVKSYAINNVAMNDACGDVCDSSLLYHLICNYDEIMMPKKSKQ